MRKKQAQRLLLCGLSFVLLVLSFGARRLGQAISLDFLDTVHLWVLGASVAVFSLLVVEFLFSNYIYKGKFYFWQHWRISNRLQKQMLDAGFGIQRSYYVELPKIKLRFSDDLATGVLRVQNALKHDKKLDDIVMSSALGKFIVETHHQTDDGNYYVYGLVDGSGSFKQTFDTFEDFASYNQTVSPYKLFLDKRFAPKLQHCLLVGQTGSGKTYGLYSLVLQMLHKSVPYELYYADPKGSSLAVIGTAVAANRTAIDVSSIIKLLEEFVALMQERKIELNERLNERLDADYSYFAMSPHVFICDEYASFASVLAAEDKKVREKVKALLYEVVLQGRQLGFFLFLIMQKSDATLIDTALRDNIPLKVVLGNSEQQTYVTAFGAGVTIPNRHYAVGEGVFTEPLLAPEPKLVQFPFLNFDILEAVTRTPVV